MTAGPFALAPAAVSGTGLAVLASKVLAFAVAAFDAGAAVQRVHFLNAQAVPCGVAAVRVRRADTRFDAGSRAARSLLGNAAGRHIANTAVQVFDFRHAQVVPRGGAAVRISSAHALHDVRIVAPRSGVGLAAGAAALAPAAILGAVLATFLTGALAIAALGAGAAVQRVHFLHAQAVPCGIAAVRVSRADTRFNAVVTTARSLVRYATAFHIADAAIQLFDFVDAKLVPFHLAAERVSLAHAFHDGRVFAPGGIIDRTAEPVARAPTAILGALLARLGTGAFTVAALGARAAVQRVHLVHAQVVPRRLTTVRIRRAHARLDRIVGATRGRLGHAAGLHVTDAAIQPFHLVDAD